MKYIYLRFIIVICVFTTSPTIVYSQSINDSLNKQNKDVELVILKCSKFKAAIENIINDTNYCKNKKLVWYLNKKEEVITLSLLIENSIPKEKVLFVTIINNYIIYLNKIDNDMEVIRTYLKFNYIDNEEIIFQDFSYWILVKDENDYILKRKVENCE